MKLLGNRILLEEIKKDTSTGLINPDSDKPTIEATVLEVGNTHTVKKGDKVTIRRSNIESYSIGLITTEDNVLAILK